ncbi:HAD-like protein [Pleomassaria siparia CBS 279.74]|uniref:HAD-like protein n=1 Tax=Pleomassaria siparia CBS 279.74 TaxID=1314801 RepID=A0A6G1JS75_9PLEO|nr:HAD-like protein [Pleomassaria siparia CBS 279.74]
MQYSTLIFDLGDVLFHWSAKTITALPRSTMASIMRSPTWNALERGEMSEEAAYEEIGSELSISPALIYEALDQAKKTLFVDNELIDTLKKLKESFNGQLKVFAMTNICKNDFAFLSTILTDWSLFDGVFTSFDARLRKPELEFYKLVIRESGANPAQTIFVDDKIENVVAARSFGITGIVFDSATSLLRKLYGLVQNPVARGTEWLQHNAGKLDSTIENGATFRDAFSQFLIWEVTEKKSFIDLEPRKRKRDSDSDSDSGMDGTWNYFTDKPVGTTASFPDDVDTTSYAMLTLSPSVESANKILDQIIANRNSDNIVQVYFDRLRPRVDPTVCINVLRLFYKYGRGHEISESLDFVTQTLKNRGYVDGTLHYYSAESFLFFVSRLILEQGSLAEIQALRPLLCERLRERVGRQSDSLAVAMRVLACQSVGVWADSDVQYLRQLQDVDGGWDMGWVCHYARTKTRIGNRGVTTSYAVKALKAAEI